jgi:rhamnogalacturonyl hydrolase YesR
LAVYKQLSATLATIQRSDGAWGANLLNATASPDPETTGTANFVYGMAWGITNGVLDAASFLPVVTKGWSYLSGKALKPNGFVSYCQPVGASPANVDQTMTSDFCVGQFLLAASEMAKLAKHIASK